MNNDKRLTVLHGDCRTLLSSLDADSISCVITDPPYNYEFIGRKWDHDEIQRRMIRIQDSSTLVKNIPYGSGLAGGVRNPRWYERNRANVIQYIEWATAWSHEIMRVCKAGAIVAVFSSTRTLAHVQVALETAGFYASFQSNILEGYSRGRDEKFDEHCTIKPTALIRRLLELFLPSGSQHIVLDPFAGTGTTLLAALELGYKAIGIEIEDRYIQIINKRVEQSLFTTQSI